MQAESTAKRMKRVKVFIFSSLEASSIASFLSVSCLFSVPLSLFSLVSLSSFILFWSLHKNWFRGFDWFKNQVTPSLFLLSNTHPHTHPCTYAPQTPLSKTVIHVPRHYIIQPQTILIWLSWKMFYKDCFKLKVIERSMYIWGKTYLKRIHLFFSKMFLKKKKKNSKKICDPIYQCTHFSTS